MKHLILLCILAFASFEVYAQVATAPFTIDEYVVNPAAARFRKYSGLSLAVSQTNIEYSATGTDPFNGDFTSSSLTEIQRLDIQYIHQSTSHFFEAYIRPQKAVISVEGDSALPTTTLGTFTTYLTENQIVFGKKSGNKFSLGVKLLVPINTGENETIVTDATASTKYSEELNYQIAILGVGMIYKPLPANIFIGFGLDVVSLTSNSLLNQVASDGSKTLLDDYSFKVTAPLPYYGIGYTLGSGKSAKARIEYSTSLSPGTTSGNLSIEFSWTKFLIGATYRSSKGYFININELMETVLDSEQEPEATKEEFGGNIGFISKKGHTFGFYVFYVESASDKRIFYTSYETVPIIEKTSSMGVSYSYAY